MSIVRPSQSISALDTSCQNQPPRPSAHRPKATSQNQPPRPPAPRQLKPVQNQPPRPPARKDRGRQRHESRKRVILGRIEPNGEGIGRTAKAGTGHPKKASHEPEGDSSKIVEPTPATTRKGW